MIKMNQGFSPVFPPSPRTLRTALLAAAFLLPCEVRAESVASKVRQGNQRYEQKMYDQALQHYSEALAPDPARNEIRYNLGNTLYRQGKFAEAATELRKAAGAPSAALQAKSLFNLGNALYRANDFQGALSQYTAALKVNPGDADTKHNLELALKKLEEQKQQQKDSPDRNRSDQDKKQEEKKQDSSSSPPEQQKKENAPQKSGQEEKREPQKSESSSGGEQKQANPPPSSQEKKMDLQEAERLLQAMEAKERQEQLRQLQLLHRQKGREKDW